MGYELIEPEEVPGFESLSLKTGEYGNVIGVNEMLAAKLPLHLYEMYMREAHHDGPQAEEQKLVDALEQAKDDMAALATRGKKSVKIDREEGTEELARSRPAPRFARQTGER
jgi:hypothetical protein